MTDFLFDAYGTLFDLSSLAKSTTDQLEFDTEEVLSRWRMLQLEYAWISVLQGRYRDFESVTRSAFVDALAGAGIDDRSMVDRLMAAFAKVEAFPDASVALSDLRAAGNRCVILSNGTQAMLQSAARLSGIKPDVDGIVSVDVAKCYKPMPTAYALGAAFMATPPSSTFFVSSNWWDIIGADNFGYKAVWLNRSGTPWPASGHSPKLKIASLGELCALA